MSLMRVGIDTGCVYGGRLTALETREIWTSTDLNDYILNEFSRGWHISDDWTPPPLVPFWGDLL